MYSSNGASLSFNSSSEIVISYFSFVAVLTVRLTLAHFGIVGLTLLNNSCSSISRGRLPNVSWGQHYKHFKYCKTYKQTNCKHTVKKSSPYNQIVVHSVLDPLRRRTDIYRLRRGSLSRPLLEAVVCYVGVSSS